MSRPTGGHSRLQSIGADAMAPERALAATLLEAAVTDWKLNAKPRPGRDWDAQRNRCTGHLFECICRTCLRDFFFGHDAGEPRAMDFRFCCDVLGLDPAAVRERLERMVPRQEVAV